MQPAWSRLATASDPAPIWAVQQGAFRSQVLGPQFEEICRDWALTHADPAGFGAEAVTRVAPAVVSMGGREQAEKDVVVFGVVAGRTMLVSIGECKWSETVTPAHVARLERVRSRLGASGIDVSRTSLAFYSRQHRGTGVRSNVPAGLKHVDIAEIYGAPADSA